MGSTIETSVCFSLILLILTIFIIQPIYIWDDSLKGGINIRDELVFHMKNDKPVSTKLIDDYYSTDTCPETINTALAGIADAISIAMR